MLPAVDDWHRRAGAPADPCSRQGSADPRGRDLGPPTARGATTCAGTFNFSANSIGPRYRGQGLAHRQQAAGWADIVSCATLSKTPLVEGAWLRNGQHIDLVGAFTPEMRESDDDAVRRARVHVDTRAGATREAGRHRAADPERRDHGGQYCCRPVRAGARRAAGREPGDDHSITLFKSVGAALEDLAAAELAVEGRTER